MNASELYQQAKLSEAIGAAIGDVKKRPAELEPRFQLAQLLCFAGDLERADKHLDTITVQEPERAVVLAMFRQLIRAEEIRRQFFAEGRVPEVIGEPTEVMKLHMQASISIREGKLSEAGDLIGQAEDLRKPITGTCDGQAFSDFRDLDDLTSPVFEVLTSNGKYFWIPIERVEFLELHPPDHLFDLIWRRVHMQVQEGPDGEVFLPALYNGSHASDNPSLQLGRATDWQGEADDLIRGLGQRMLLVGEEDRSIMELSEIHFNTTAIESQESEGESPA